MYRQFTIYPFWYTILQTILLFLTRIEHNMRIGFHQTTLKGFKKWKEKMDVKMIETNTNHDFCFFHYESCVFEIM